MPWQKRARQLPTPVQQVGQRAVLEFGRATATARMSPRFLICGAQRCGTTTMYRTLSQHPDLLKPVLHKGVHYFDTGNLHGSRWYRAHFPMQRTARRAAAHRGVTPLTFESSPYYLFHPLAIGRIAHDLPAIRVVILLRDPIERAYSAHTHETARGFEDQPFERALELEDSRLLGEEAKIVADPTYNSHAHQHQGYLSRGRYLPQLQRVEQALGRDRMHVVDAEDFWADPDPVWRGVVSFLGLSDLEVPKFERHNARPRSPMPESLRKRLTDEFEQDDDELARWWGQVPSWRR